MWFLYLIVGLVAIVVWVIWSSVTLCPRCGLELPREFAAPWRRVELCRCGWREGQRP
jgi:hypothetical protein